MAKKFSFRPANCTLLPVTKNEEERWQQAWEVGHSAIAAGKIAAATVAGGQASRLGFPHSKGLFPISPVRNKPLFQIFAEKIRSWEKRVNQKIFWLILSSETNHGEICDFFQKHSNFGLERVRIFPQGMLPTLDLDGRLLMQTKNSLAMHPDGHGGLLEALGNSGLIDTLREDGVAHLSYFQVDNPLAMPLDPHFIGFHLLAGAQLSSRCVQKAYGAEKVGVFVESDDRLRVMEYSDLPAECAAAMDVSNRLRFNWANIAIHLFDLDFLESFCHNAGWQALPFHLSLRKVPFINDAGHLVRPIEPNGIKLERLIFDLLPLTDRTLLLEGRREEIFSPVKNLAGMDSAETSKRDQIRLFAEWLSSGKTDVPRAADGTLPFAIEISPLFADTLEEFLKKWAALDNRPPVVEGFYLE
jgi:UDP-N-acetylglucosamine/UDP-N-acetylgalactosamine diphosphorylase